MALFDLQSEVVVSPSPVSCELNGEAAILDPVSGTYYGLNEVGARIWALVQQRTTIAALRDRLLAEYDIDEATCVREVSSLLEKLVDRGLVTVREVSPTP